MKIGVFSYRLPVRGQRRGGIERVAHDLAQGLALRGHDVRVWSHDPAPPTAHYRVEPLPWRALAERALGHRLMMGYLGNLLPLVTRVADRDALIFHGDSLLAPLARKPFIRIFHGSALDEAITARTWPRRLAQLGVYAGELVSALQKGAVAVSDASRKRVPWVRHVIRNGIDLDRFKPDPARKTPTPSVLFVGSPGGRKRGDLLVEWFEKFIRPRHPDAVLHMVSAPGRRSPGVEYHEGISDDGLIHLYQSAWVYASPSVYEGFGLPYVEAMACGAPVIAVPNAGSLEVLDQGRYGLIAADETFPRVLAELLQAPDERSRWITAGLGRAKSFDIKAAAEKYERLLFDLVN